MSLAPSEQLTLEFQQSQRRVLEQSKVDSAEEMDSIESTTVDKEAFNATRSSSKTENWHVDGSGSFGIGKLSIGAGAGISTSITDSSQSSIQQVTEATKKSAHSLRTLHKIEVRGVTEGLIQNRMTRVVKNPYRDRTLSLNVFQLIKHFFVKTHLVDLRPVLAIEVKLNFNKDFVLGNSDFLQEKLLDQSLIDNLPEALKGAKPLLLSDAAEEATEIAKLALRYLFGGPGPERNIFNMPHVLANLGFGDRDLGDPNDPATSFDAQAPRTDSTVVFGHSGVNDAINTDLGGIFTVLNLFFRVYQELNDPADPGKLDKKAVALATALKSEVGQNWEDLLKDPHSTGKIHSILDNNDFTEVFRRLAGFQAIISGMLEPLLDAVKQENEAAHAHELEVFSLNHLLEHLQCEVNYYTQQFLVYIAHLTNNQAIVDFINRVTDRIPEPSRDLIPQVFDIERSFIDRQQIKISAFNPLTDDQVTQLADHEFRSENIKPTVVEVDLPCDGIHLEVAPGACILQDLPPQEKTVEFTIHDANLKVTAP